MTTIRTPRLRWPEGKTMALSFSWDDGRTYDRRVVDIHNAHGVKGTFHLNSGNLEPDDGPGRFLRRSELPELFRDHEVSVHSVTHPWPSRIPPSAWLEEVRTDKVLLEEWSGRVVRSASWPYGDFSSDSIEVLRMVGITSCRWTRGTDSCPLPEEEDWLKWAPTCHFFPEKTLALWQERSTWHLQRGHAGWFSPWSHSYELEDRDEWAALDEFCRVAGGSPDTWNATVSDVQDYLHAWRQVLWSTDHTRAVNRSNLTLFAAVDGTVLVIPPGEHALKDM